MHSDELLLNILTNTDLLIEKSPNSSFGALKGMMNTRDERSIAALGFSVFTPFP